MPAPRQAASSVSRRQDWLSVRFAEHQPGALAGVADHAWRLDRSGDVGGAAADVASAEHTLQDRLRLDAVLERHDGGVDRQERLDDAPPRQRGRTS